MGLSKYIATPVAEQAFESYVQGYAAGGGRLTKQEAKLAPELIILSVFFSSFLAAAVGGCWRSAAQRASAYPALTHAFLSLSLSLSLQARA